jgi:hypothetical protein
MQTLSRLREQLLSPLQLTTASMTMLQPSQDLTSRIRKICHSHSAIIKRSKFLLLLVPTIMLPSTQPCRSLQKSQESQ